MLRTATLLLVFFNVLPTFAQTDYKTTSTRNADWGPDETMWLRYTTSWVATSYYPGESGGPTAGLVKIMDSDTRWIPSPYNLSIGSLKLIKDGAGGVSDSRVRVNNGATLTVTGNVIFANTNTLDFTDNTLTVTGILNANSNINATGDGSQNGSYNQIIITNTGTLTVAGNITFGSNDQRNLITNSGILNMAGTFTRTSAAAVSTMTDYHTAGNTVVYNGAAQTVYADVYDNLTLSGSGTKTAEGNITVNGNLTISDGITFADAGYTITVKGNVINNGTHSGTGKIYLNGGASSHAISGDAVNTLGILQLNDTQGATFTGSGATTISGTLTVTAGTLTLNAFTTSLTVTGATSVAGTVTIANTTGTKSFTGDVTINGTWNNSANENISMASNLTVNTGATFTAGSGVYTLSGTTKSIGGTIAALAIPSLTVSGTYTNDIDGLTVSTALSGGGTLTNSANNFLYIGGTSGITTLTATSAANTVDFTQAGGDQSLYATTYTNLTVSGGSTKTAAGAVNVTGALTLTNGIIVTTAANILTMKDASTTTVGIATSFINGPMNYDMALSGTRTLKLPLGKSSDWRPAELTAVHSSATSYTYNAEVMNASADALGWTLPSTVDLVSKMHYWDILRYATADLTTAVPSTDVSGNQTIKLYYAANDVVTDETNLTICKNTSGEATTWIDIGGTGATATNGSVTSSSDPTAFTSFSRFTIGNRTGGSNPLPIELISFTALLNENNTVISSWTTATETNNDYFTIEKTNDGIHFENAGTIDGAGNSTLNLSYSFNDNSPYQGISYYRLKQTDFDGKYSFSNLISVNNIMPCEITIFPNPSDGKALFLKTNGFDNGEILVVLYNPIGQVSYSKVILHHEGAAIIALHSSNELPPGIYLIVGSSGNNEVFRKKLMVNSKN